MKVVKIKLVTGNSDVVIGDAAFPIVMKNLKSAYHITGI